ncbi:MAG: galactokinase [Planctomycetota bacterium]|nr:MAG: galactokinase [Planctomycetota bacterium]
MTPAESLTLAATAEAAQSGFQRAFGSSPEVVARAPGRVNLIGDHTDYTGGFVLPIAIDRATVVAAARSTDGRFRARSSAFPETATWDARVAAARRGATDNRAAFDLKSLPSWARYVFGVAQVLREQGVEVGAGGADVFVLGDVPPGAGLASSAALEVATATALIALSGAQAAPLEVARWCQRAENEYAGSPCGVMDQTISACAREGHALLIDCLTMSLRHVPLNLGDACLVVMDSGVRHSIAAGEYAARRRDCEAGLAVLSGKTAPVRSLRDVEEAQITANPWLSSTVRRRLRHVVRENQRVLEAASALKRGDINALGRLMLASHASLREDFEVSCAELDRLVGLARSVPGIYGARMTGGGFGGCVIVLVREDAVDALRAAATTGPSPPAASFMRVRSRGAACVVSS